MLRCTSNCSRSWLWTMMGSRGRRIVLPGQQFHQSNRPPSQYSLSCASTRQYSSGLGASSTTTASTASDDIFFSQDDGDSLHSTTTTTSSARSSFHEDNDIPDHVMQQIEEYCQKPQTPVSMQTFIKTGRHSQLSHHHSANNKKRRSGVQKSSSQVLIQIANFLRQELPVRLAHRIQDLQHLPILANMPSVQQVKHIYVQSFVDLINYPTIRSHQDEVDFSQFLTHKYDEHSNVLITMAKGAYELRQQQQLVSNNVDDFTQWKDCHAFLDRFYMSRIGIRVLAGQYLALRQQALASNNSDYVGMVCLHTSPLRIIQQAAHDATQMCVKRYGVAPAIHVEGHNLNVTFPYIPTYLHYMVLELLKNSVRATVEFHSRNNNKNNTNNHHVENNNNNDLPPVKVIIADGHDNEDVVIKVADVGGGIARSHLAKIWSYLFTTACPTIQESFIGNNSNHHANDNDNNNKAMYPNHHQQQQQQQSNSRDHDPQTSPLAGLGFGLPISRSYARYFKGDLNILSMEGYGTDAYIHLKRIDVDDLN